MADEIRAPWSNIPTAPTEVIGDDGDLRTIRDALRAGKSVTLAPDGKVYVGQPVHQPMTTEVEDMVEAKMGQIVAMSRAGFGVTVTPSGTVSGDRNDHNMKVLFNVDPDLDDEQLMLVRQGISDGAELTIHTDGTVVYHKNPDARPPTGEVARELNAIVDEQIANGGLRGAMGAGEVMIIKVGTNEVTYTTMPESAPAGIAFPEEPPVPPLGPQPNPPAGTDDRRDATASAHEVRASAIELERVAQADRERNLEEFTEASTATLDARRQAALDQAAANAVVGKADEQGPLNAELIERLTNELATAKLNAPGNEEIAEEALRIAAEIDQLAARQATLAEQRARSVADADAAATRAADAEKEYLEQVDARDAAEARIDNAEDRALVLRVASDQLEEAERLQTAAADLQARGDHEGAARVRSAAIEQQSSAEHTLWEAEQLAAADEIGLAPAELSEADTNHVRAMDEAELDQQLFLDSPSVDVDDGNELSESLQDAPQQQGLPNEMLPAPTISAPTIPAPTIPAEVTIGSTERPWLDVLAVDLGETAEDFAAVLYAEESPTFGDLVTSGEDDIAG